MATMFWAEAIKKAGTDDVDAVIKAWEGLKYNGPAGEWVMRACDHQAQVPIWMAEIVAKVRVLQTCVRRTSLGYSGQGCGSAVRQDRLHENKGQVTALTSVGYK